MTSTEVLERRQLFGGAILIECPSRLMDISDFRPTPDNQEILADGASDESLIVEIVEHCEDAQSCACPAEFFFNNLQEESEAVSGRLLSSTTLGASAVPLIDTAFPKSVAVGELVISKGRQPGEAANLIHVTIAAIQLKHVNSDVLITLNTPLVINPQSAAAEHAGAGARSDDQAASSQRLFERMLATFQIVDFALFGE